MFFHYPLDPAAQRNVSIACRVMVDIMRFDAAVEQPTSNNFADVAEDTYVTLLSLADAYGQ